MGLPMFSMSTNVRNGSWTLVGEAAQMLSERSTSSQCPFSMQPKETSAWTLLFEREAPPQCPFAGRGPRVPRPGPSNRTLERREARS